jgi:predicted DNA binding CopG/RHH family protein
MMAKKSRIPDFKSDVEEMEFWDTHSPEEFADELEVVHDVSFAGMRLKPISLRVDTGHMGFIRALAAEKGIGYQTMLRMWINERTAEELAAWERRHPRPAASVAPPRKKPARKPAAKPARKTAAKVAAKAGLPVEET